MKWRILIGVVALAAAGWAAWWFVGSSAQEAGLRAWLEDRRAAGWVAEAESIETAGFPNRFDTRLTGLRLADPEEGWSWTAPFLDIMMLSYQPNQAILAFPPEQSFAAPGTEAVLTTDRMLASARLAPSPALPVQRVSAEIEEARLAGPGGTTTVNSLQAHLQEADPVAGEPAYDVFVELEGLRPPEAALEAAGLGALPGIIDRLSLDGRVALDRRLDRHALEEAPPAIRAIVFEQAEAAWGRLSLRASGEIAADAAGLAEGEIAIHARNWREMLRAAVEMGAVEPDMAGLVETGLSLIAGFGGDRESIEAPLRFRDGRAWIGPIPIGRAPRLAPPAG